jgi:hypothetical protein
MHYKFDVPPATICKVREYLVGESLMFKLPYAGLGFFLKVCEKELEEQGMASAVKYSLSHVELYNEHIRLPTMPNAEALHQEIVKVMLPCVKDAVQQTATIMNEPSGVPYESVGKDLMTKLSNAGADTTVRRHLVEEAVAVLDEEAAKEAAVRDKNTVNKLEALGEMLQQVLSLKNKAN